MILFLFLFIYSSLNYFIRNIFPQTVLKKISFGPYLSFGIRCQFQSTSYVKVHVLYWVGFSNLVSWAKQRLLYYQII